MDRSYTLYEAREVIKQKEAKIQRLMEENAKQAARIIVLEQWNIQWQTVRWDRELARHCHAISKEFSTLSEPETKIVKYLLGLTSNMENRHVRAISKAIGISLGTTHYNIQKLVKKKLIRCYSWNSNKKKYYCLPDSRLFLR